MYVSVIHDLCIALWAQRLTARLLLSPHIKPPHLPQPPVPPPGNHCPDVCAHEFKCYIPHMSEIRWSLDFSDWLVSRSVIFSRSITLLRMAVFRLFLGLSSVPSCKCTMPPSSTPLSKDILVVSMWGTVPSVGNVAQPPLGKPVGSEVGEQDPRPWISSPVGNQACIVLRLL